MHRYHEKDATQRSTTTNVFGKTHWGTTVTHVIAARINYSFTKLLIRPSLRNVHVFIINCLFCGSAARVIPPVDLLNAKLSKPINLTCH